MKLPKEPTVLPRGRTYARQFTPDAYKTYTAGSQMIINIPPIDRCYLTKNTQLYFTATLKYQECTQDQLTSLQTASGITNAEMKNFTSNLYAAGALNQPLPCLDINGPYGLISQIDVYDYLGTTLLETVPNHHLLTATLADYWFSDSELELNRPLIQDLTGAIRKRPGTLMSNLTLQEFQSRGWGVDAATGLTVTSRTTTVKYNIDLVSFLGLLSDSFVPLHNGFQLRFTVVNPDEVITITNAAGGNTALLRTKSDSTTYVLQPLTPSIQDFYLSEPSLNAKILEVPPEVDDKVNKLIFTKQFKYTTSMLPLKASKYATQSTTTNPLPATSTEKWSKHFVRLPVEVKSLTKLYTWMRPLYTPSERIYMQKLGYRIKNAVSSVSLLLDKANVFTISSPLEAYYQSRVCLGKQIDQIYSYSDVSIDAPVATKGTQGKGGYIYAAEEYGNSIAAATAQAGTSAAIYPNDLLDLGSKTVSGSTVYQLLNKYQGKSLWAFDTRLPGYEANSVVGVDTSEKVLEVVYEGDTSSTTVRHMIDVFAEYDALIHVDPGKTTSVSF